MYSNPNGLNGTLFVIFDIISRYVRVFVVKECRMKNSTKCSLYTVVLIKLYMIAGASVTNGDRVSLVAVIGSTLKLLIMFSKTNINIRKLNKAARACYINT